MTLRVAIYARVSTLHQAQAQTIEQQLTRLRAYANDQQWLVQDAISFVMMAAVAATSTDQGWIGCATRCVRVNLIGCWSPNRIASRGTTSNR